MKKQITSEMEKIIRSSECVNEIEIKLKNLGDYDELLHQQHRDHLSIHARRMSQIEMKLHVLACVATVLFGLVIYLILSR